MFVTLPVNVWPLSVCPSASAYAASKTAFDASTELELLELLDDELLDELLEELDEELLELLLELDEEFGEGLIEFMPPDITELDEELLPIFSLPQAVNKLSVVKTDKKMSKNFFIPCLQIFAETAFPFFCKITEYTVFFVL